MSLTREESNSKHSPYQRTKKAKEETKKVDPTATPTPEPAADTASENGGGADTSDGSETVQSDSTQTSDQTKTTAEDSQTSAGRLQLRKILLGIGAAMVLLIIILCIALARKERRYSE